MRRNLLIPGLLCMTALLPDGPAASAQEGCAEPAMPAPVNGSAVSEDQMRAAAAAARGFIAQSDVYQACLTGQLEAARTQANADGKPLDPGTESAIKIKVSANQKAKEKVGADINSAIGVYKKSHPG
jgi:hypothetical protein